MVSTNLRRSHAPPSNTLEVRNPHRTPDPSMASCVLVQLWSAGQGCQGLEIIMESRSGWLTLLRVVEGRLRGAPSIIKHLSFGEFVRVTPQVPGGGGGGGDNLGFFLGGSKLGRGGGGWHSSLEMKEKLDARSLAVVS